MSQAQAPICFGAITFYAEDSDHCLACASYSGCGKKVQENIAEVSQVLDVKSLLEAHRRVQQKRKREKEKLDSGKVNTVTPATFAVNGVPVADVKKEAKELLVKMTAASKLSMPQLKASIAAKQNPFKQSTVEPWLLCELMIRGSATRDAVTAGLKKLGGSNARIEGAMQVVATLN